MPEDTQVREAFDWRENVIESAPESIAVRAAHALYDAGSIGFHFDDSIEHRSGIRAPIYIDVRKAFGNPETSQTLIGLMADFARASAINKPEVVVAVPMGGMAPALGLARELFVPFSFVRNEVKAHGTKKQIEGADIESKQCLLVEDVVNLGTSSLPAVEKVRSAGGTVTDVLAVVTYGYTKTVEQFAEAGVKLHTLTTVPDIVEVGVTRGALSRDDADKVLEWLKEQDKNNEKI